MSGPEEMEEPTRKATRSHYCKWTESMRLRLLDTVIAVHEELGKGGFASHLKSQQKWRLITKRMPEDFFDQRVHRKTKWASTLKSQFTVLRRFFLSEKYPWWFTDQMCTKMKECEDLMFLEANVNSASVGFCDQGLHDEISPEARAHDTAAASDEPHIDVLVGRQDGREEHLQDHPCAPIQDDVSLPRSTDWVTMHVSNTSLPTSSPRSSRRGKRAISESSLTTSSSSEEATGDASPSRALRRGRRYPKKSRPVGLTLRQKSIDDSAASRYEGETSAKRTGQCQGPDNVSQRRPSPEDVENVSNTIFVENMKSSLFASKLLEGLPGERTLDSLLGEVLVTQEHGRDNTERTTRLPESTTGLFDRIIHDQQQTKNRVQLMIQARHKELKVRMTEVITQTGDDLLHLLHNFASGES